jgi:hypothetical protein
LLDDGKAVTFPYAFAPYVLGALIYPVLGNWAVSLLMVVAVAGTVWATGLARPAMRDPWLALLFVLNPFFIDSVFAFQFATLWSALFFFAFVWAFEREKNVSAAALMWLAVSSHPLMGTLAVGGYAAIGGILHPERVRRLVLIGTPVLVALIPIYYWTLSIPSVNDDPGSWVRTTLSSIASRSTIFGAPFVIAWAAPWLRRHYRPALGFGFAAAAVGVLFLGGFVHYYRSPSGYYGIVHSSSDTYAEYFASPQFAPGSTYRVLEPSEREDGMYRFIRHGAVLANEFFTESTMQRPWTMDQYACYTAFKQVDYVVIEKAYEDRVHFNEGQILQSLVSDGKASVSYSDPGGRFVVYNIAPFVAQQQKPDSLSQCSL